MPSGTKLPSGSLTTAFMVVEEAPLASKVDAALVTVTEPTVTAASVNVIFVFFEIAGKSAIVAVTVS